MVLPTFFLAGAPKSGTTSLYAHLGKHPEVYVSTVKEPHFFTAAHDGWPKWGVQTMEEYAALFEGGQECAVRGEGSTWYLYSPHAADAIHRAVPDARFILSLRNPIERAYSAWAYNVEKGWETELTFEEALAKEEGRMREAGFWDRHYVHAGLYSEQVRRYVQRFSSDLVHVILSEDLRRNPDRVLAKMYDFLDVDASYVSDQTAEVHNRSRFPRYSKLNRLLKNDRLRAAMGLMPSGLVKKIKGVVGRANTKERPPISDSTRRMLAGRFRDDVHRLEEIVGMDLHDRWLGKDL